LKVIVNKQDSITKGSTCAIGSFDGLHRGHQRIIRYLRRLAHPGNKIGIITFRPLPFLVLHHAAICCLTPKEEKERILQALGVDFIYYFNFTSKFAQLSPNDFVQLIAKNIAPAAIAVGKNFHFGRRRQGSVHLFKKFARNLFDVRILPILKDEGIISSTRIRELLLLGHVKAANRLLGREYAISGTVIKGKGKGKRLGFPTINIKVLKDKLLPLDGVYKVVVVVDNKEFLGALFCQHNVVEVHLIDFTGNLYKREVTIKLLERIRDIRKFSDDNSLKIAIAADIRKVQPRIKKSGVGP